MHSGAQTWNAWWVDALRGSNPLSSAGATSAAARTTAPADVRASSFGPGSDSLGRIATQSRPGRPEAAQPPSLCPQVLIAAQRPV